MNGQWQCVRTDTLLFIYLLLLLLVAKQEARPFHARWCVSVC